MPVGWNYSGLSVGHNLGVLCRYHHRLEHDRVPGRFDAARATADQIDRLLHTPEDLPPGRYDTDPESR